MVTIGALMTVLTLVTARAVGTSLHDPDGFLGPSWSRLPLLVLFAFALDVVPRSLWRARGRPRAFLGHARGVVAEHWTRQRAVLVVVGLVSFYATYISYRNLKGFLPFVREIKYDYALHTWDRTLLGGHDPAVLLHRLLGTDVAANLLSAVYVSFLPMVALSVVLWLVWSRTIGLGRWFATSTCLAWAFGTASYYLVPTMGPAFFFPWLYQDLHPTTVTTLQDNLDLSRKAVLGNPLSQTVQTVAGFASLHVALTLLFALTVHVTFRAAWARRAVWVFFGLTVVSTLYFGWHYIADDLAGAAIGLASFVLGAWLTGEQWRCHPAVAGARRGPVRVPVEHADHA